MQNGYALDIFYRDLRYIFVMMVGQGKSLIELLIEKEGAWKGFLCFGLLLLRLSMLEL